MRLRRPITSRSERSIDLSCSSLEGRAPSRPKKKARHRGQPFKPTRRQSGVATRDELRLVQEVVSAWLHPGEHGGFLVKDGHCLLQLVKVKRFGHHHVHIQLFVSANLLVREMSREHEDLAAKVFRPELTHQFKA